jgi:hypothetical protein
LARQPTCVAPQVRGAVRQSNHAWQPDPRATAPRLMLRARPASSNCQYKRDASERALSISRASGLRAKRAGLKPTCGQCGPQRQKCPSVLGRSSARANGCTRQCRRICTACAPASAFVRVKIGAVASARARERPLEFDPRCPAPRRQAGACTASHRPLRPRVARRSPASCPIVSGVRRLARRCTVARTRRTRLFCVARSSRAIMHIEGHGSLGWTLFRPHTPRSRSSPRPPPRSCL